MVKLIVALVLVTIVKHNVTNEPQWRWSDRDASIISYLGATPADYEISVTRPKSSGIQNLKVAISDGQNVLCRFDSHYQGAFLFDRDRHWIVYSQYSPIATGCTLIAFDLKAKRQVWETHLKGIGPVSHSKWRNRINLKLERDRITVFGDEGAKYIESVSLDSGESIYHRLVDLIEFDGQQLEYQKLLKLARERDISPGALSDCKAPGILKDGKPWSGTFVWQSHKTNLIIEKYEDGLRHGPSVGYQTPKIRHWIGEYVKGEKHGREQIWNATGRLHSTSVYEHGERVSEKQE